MADTPTIAPALTPEEWASNPYIAGWDDGSVFFLPYSGGHEVPKVERPHALAALALHGQPFGFTREDVANEIAAAEECEKWAASSEGTVLDDDKVPGLLTRAYLHRSLAARIEALLPPETTPNG